MKILSLAFQQKSRMGVGGDREVVGGGDGEIVR